MNRHLARIALSASMLALSCGTSFADYTLTILHFNDWHSRIESINKYDSTCSVEEENKSECFGGAARLATAIAGERKKLAGHNVLLLDAGDNFQGSLFYTTFKGAAEEEFLNQWKIDAMTLGNHEFDNGESALVPFLDKANFPVLGANVVPDRKSGAYGKIKPSIVLTVGGQKIGIVGAVTDDTPELSSPGPDIAITDDVKAITEQVEKLRAEGVDKIIALTHVGYNRDRQVIAKIPGIDVVVGGHSHTYLSSTDPRAGGPYPALIDNPDGIRVPVVQAASYSKYLGELTVVFDDNGNVKDATGAPIPLDSSVKPDPAVLARIKELGKPIEDLKTKIVSETTAAIDGTRDSCRARECQMGDLVSDAILDRTRGQGVTIAISNGGGLRASIDQGPVTMGEVLTVLPFQNTVATFQLSGKDLVAGLENGVSQLEDGAGRFAQVAGLKYAFDRSKAPGSRVSDVEVMDGGNWAPIDQNKDYLVATNNYVRQGGDGYKIFADKAKNAYDYGPGLEQVVADYLGAHNPYTPKLDGRITEIAATAAAEPAKAPAAATPPASEPAKPAETEPAMPALPAGSDDIAKAPPSMPADTTPPASGPAPATPAPAPAETAPAQPMESTHVVAKGDTYWDLAVKYYGDGAKWHMIADANKAYEPRRLPVGAMLKIPAK